MRVLMIAAAFPPSNSAGVHRTARFARMLPEFGWEPVVLTQTGSDGGDVPEWVRRLRVERLVAAGAEGARVSSPVKQRRRDDEVTAARGGGLKWLRRLGGNLEDLLFHTPDREVQWVRRNAVAALQLAEAEGVEAVYTSGPPHSLHLLGLQLKSKLGLPWVMDFRDPWARKPWGFKASNPWGQRLLGRFERRCVRAADRVILNTPRMADEFGSHYEGLPGERFVAIPNGCDPELRERAERLLVEEAVQPSRGERTQWLCHAGSLYRERDPRPIIAAIELLRGRGRDVGFSQVGNCQSAESLKGYAREMGVGDRVKFEPPVTHDESLRRMARADVLLLIQPGTDLQVPGKLFEMLLFRKPIVALADVGATADIIERYGLGAVAKGDDPAAIAAAVERVIGWKGERARDARWGEACREFDGRRLTGRLAELLEGVVSPAPAAAARVPRHERAYADVRE